MHLPILSHTDMTPPQRSQRPPEPHRRVGSKEPLQSWIQSQKKLQQQKIPSSGWSGLKSSLKRNSFPWKLAWCRTWSIFGPPVGLELRKDSPVSMLLVAWQKPLVIITWLACEGGNCCVPSVVYLSSHCDVSYVAWIPSDTAYFLNSLLVVGIFSVRWPSLLHRAMIFVHRLSWNKQINFLSWYTRHGRKGTHECYPSQAKAMPLK